MPAAGAPYRYEGRAWSNGLVRVAGVDEAGRGPLAGPVVAAAVMLDQARRIRGLDDSKRLAPDRREELHVHFPGRVLVGRRGRERALALLGLALLPVARNARATA